MMMPVHTTFEKWAHTLIIDFPNDNIPIYKNGYNWKLWANAVAECPSFNQNACPGGTDFSDPLKWAAVVYRQMLNFA